MADDSNASFPQIMSSFTWYLLVEQVCSIDRYNKRKFVPTSQTELDLKQEMLGAS